jgi:hypothetical protein
LFELKYDGFRALAHIRSGQCHLVSRNGNPFASFSDLGDSIAGSLPFVQDAVLDGEIVCLDQRGRPQFKNLLFRRGAPCYFAFDLLWSEGKDHRLDGLQDRKQELRRLLSIVPEWLPLRYADHIDGKGIALFERMCKLDLEGVVAKHRYAPYVSVREPSFSDEGPLTETPMELMKSWVDKTAAQGNIWLVLVFHGVNGVGWKPKTGAESKDYFGYINSKKHSLWVATFQDVTKKYSRTPAERGWLVHGR